MYSNIELITQRIKIAECASIRQMLDMMHSGTAEHIHTHTYTQTLRLRVYDDQVLLKCARVAHAFAIAMKIYDGDERRAQRARNRALHATP